MSIVSIARLSCVHDHESWLAMHMVAMHQIDDAPGPAGLNSQSKSPMSGVPVPSFLFAPKEWTGGQFEFDSCEEDLPMTSNPTSLFAAGKRDRIQTPTPHQLQDACAGADTGEPE